MHSFLPKDTMSLPKHLAFFNFVQRLHMRHDEGNAQKALGGRAAAIASFEKLHYWEDHQ